MTQTEAPHLSEIIQGNHEAQMEQAQNLARKLADVIKKRGLWVKIGDKAHITVDGYQLLGWLMGGIYAQTVSTERLDNGWLATAEARHSERGVIGRGTAICTRDEQRWAGRPEHQLLSMAQTRAWSKAMKSLGFIVQLAGYDPASAEETTSEIRRPRK